MGIELERRFGHGKTKFLNIGTTGDIPMVIHGHSHPDWGCGSTQAPWHYVYRAVELVGAFAPGETGKRKEENTATRAMTTGVVHGYAVKGQMCICLKWQAANLSAGFKCLWKIIEIKTLSFGDFGVPDSGLVSARSFRSARTTRRKSHKTITELSWRERFLLFQRQIASSDAHTGIKTALRCSSTPSYLRSISNP